MPITELGNSDNPQVSSKQSESLMLCPKSFDDAKIFKESWPISTFKNCFAGHPFKEEISLSLFRLTYGNKQSNMTPPKKKNNFFLYF